MARKITVGVMLGLFVYIVSPFAAAVGMGAIFAVLFYPWMKRIDLNRFPNSLAAGLFTFAVTLLLFLPVCTMLVAGVRSGLSELKQLKRMTSEPSGTSSGQVLDQMFETVGLERLLVRASRVAPIDPAQVSDQLKEGVSTLAVHLGDVLSAFIAHIPNMIVAFSVFLFSMYYFLADGVRFVHAIRKRSMFNEAQTARLMNTFAGLCRSVILASLVSGSVQALVALTISLAVGVKQFALVALVVFVASFIPLLGSFPIMISIALYHLIGGHTTAGIALSVGALLIASIDHFIRPQVIRGSSNLHPLLGFISALGGLEVFGISGVFLGPVLCGLFVEVVDIY